MSVKVSVVIPVYNPGKYIEVCIDSLLGQSLPTDEYEAIFVDDGSTDETPERLDRLAAEHANIQVIHIPNSGWPGKPRNVGIDAAAGEFIQFVDHDDWLGPEALERMHAYGVANDADVIVGRMAGQGRGVPRELFRINRPVADLDNAPLIDGLTPHKMFRRSFLTEIGLRYPEGRRRLEDHVFVIEAFLRARNISVLSDYVCYYHTRRDDTANAGTQWFDPVGYFGNLREALDVVDRYTEPGPLRDKLYRRWLRFEMVDRLRGHRMLRWPEDIRPSMFAEIHKLAVERFGPDVAAGMQPMQQMVCALVMAGEYDEAFGLAQWEVGISASTLLRELRWVDGVLHVAYDAEFHAAGAPMTFQRREGVEVLDPPLGPSGREAVAAYGADTGVRPQQTKADLVLRHRETGAEYFQPMTIEWQFTGPDEARRFVVAAVATIDQRTAATDQPLVDGVWDLHVRLSANGWTKQARLGAVRTDGATAARTGAVIGERIVAPYWTEPHDNLSISVATGTKRIAKEFAGVRPESATVTRQQIRVALPLHVPTRTPVTVRYTETATKRQSETTGALDVDGALTADLPSRGRKGSRTRLAVAFPALKDQTRDAEAPKFVKLGIALEMRGREIPLVVSAATKPVTGKSSRYTPRRVVAALRRRAGRIKRRLLG